MPRITVIDPNRFKFVRLVARDNGRYCLRWKDGDTWRLQSVGQDIDVARAHAERKDKALAKEANLLKDSKLGLLRIDRMLEDSIRLGGGGERHKQGLESHARRFTRWLALRRPEIVYCHQLRQSVIVQFIDESLAGGAAVMTCRHDLQVLSRMFARLNMLEPDSYGLLRIRHPRLRQTAPRKKRFLEWDQLGRLLEHAPDGLKAAVLLGGYCGLRLSECCEVRPEHIDHARLTLQTGRKNAASVRCIPVPGWVATALGGLGVTSEGYYLPRDGCIRVERLVGRHLARVARRLQLDIQPHCLRHSFVNAAAAAGVLPEHLRAYIGHSSGRSVLEIHYADFARLDLLRREVVEKMTVHFARSVATVVELHA